MEYIYEGGLLMRMTYGNYVLDFSYDANGTPVGFRAKTTGLDKYYYYGLNFRGDVIALYNADGTLHARYEYDAYGKLLGVKASDGTSITATYAIATLNPLRYRSYVYDNETGLYYLQSRYYDPTTCRFINADGYISTGQGINGYNMFAYCNNNPVMYLDYSGKRYCAGSNPDEETSNEIAWSCQWQNRVVQSKNNPKPYDSYSRGDIYIVDNYDGISDIKAFYPGDIIVVDELSVDGNLYIWKKRKMDVPKDCRAEINNYLDNYAISQGVSAYEIMWEHEITWQDAADMSITIGGIIYSYCTNDYGGMLFTILSVLVDNWDIFFNK